MKMTASIKTKPTNAIKDLLASIFTGLLLLATPFAVATPISSLIFADSNLEICVNDTAAANSWTESNEVTTLICNNLGITDASGIEALSNLQILRLENNLLMTLAISALTNLTELKVSGNQLTSLEVTGLNSLVKLSVKDNQLTRLTGVAGLTNLTKLFAQNNQLTSIDVTGSSRLVNLRVQDNQLASLTGTSNLSKLKKLFFHNNQLRSIDLTGLRHLETLSAYNNLLISLELRGLSSLDTVQAQNNQLTSLTGTTDLTSLTRLIVRHNQLTSLDMNGASALIDLRVNDNQLTSLTGVSGLTALTTLLAENNQLTTIEVSGNNSLEILRLQDNQLIEINSMMSLSHAGFTTLNLARNPALLCSELEALEAALTRTTIIHPTTCTNNKPVANDDIDTTSEDTAITITVLGNDSDVDGDTLTITAVTQGANGSVIFTATDVTYIPHADFSGDDSFTYTIDDGYGGTDIATVTITVLNTPPVIISTPITVANINENYQYQLQALDVDGDTLEYSLITSPFGMTITSDEGLIEWIPDTADQVSMEVQVDDGQFATDLQAYTLTVIDPAVNYAPEIISTPVTEGLEGILYEYPLEVIDVNNDTLTYTLSSAPIGMAVDAETGLIRWGSPLAGVYAIEVTVEDPDGLTDRQSYTLTILGPIETNTIFQSMWDGMFQDLLNGDKNSAMQRLSPEAQIKYGQIFDELLPFMDEIVTNYTALVRIAITPETAEYMVRRIGGDGVKTYFIYFIRDFQGNWKLNSM